MRNTYLRFIILLTILGTALCAEPAPAVLQGSIRARITDDYNSQPLEYANSMLYCMRDSSFVTGAASDQHGYIRLPDIQPGRYYLQVSFMGYQDSIIMGIAVNRSNNRIDLGDLALRRNVLASQAIDVIADRPLVEYRIDKKVVNVREEYTSMSGTAVDILENVPSINVDIEGNVELRGSSSFMVLIDNRPTALDASDALQQIPATTIENIEIITNPSAKYDPEGVSGIINIITKKNRLEGVSGLVNTNGGPNEKHGGNFLVSYRNGFGSLALGANYDLRTHPGTSKTENSTFYNDTTTTVLAAGTSLFQRRRMGLNGELHLFLGERDNLTFSFRLGDFSMESNSDLDYHETQTPGSIDVRYSSTGLSERSGAMLAFSTDYSHHFADEGEFTARINLHQRGGDEKSQNTLADLTGNSTSGQRTTEKGPASSKQVQVNYKRTLPANYRFEGGYDGRLGHSQDITTFAEFDTTTGLFTDWPEYGHDISYDRNIHALYTMLARETGRYGFQLGLRSELTDRAISTIGEDSYTINSWDFFPSLHGSYKVTELIQLMASYSRRIDRPRGWSLEPFLTWDDAYNVRQGNPSLKPEYIDSYELGLQIPFRKNLVAVETYYRSTVNVIERIRSVYAPNIMLQRSQNVGTSKAAGIELMCNLRELDWWDINLTGNLYYYQLDANLGEKDYSRSSNNWNMRLNNTFRIGDNTRIQFSSNYRSATTTAQGESKGRLSSNLGIRQSCLDRKLSTTLQINDIFGESVRESTSTGDGFYAYSRYSREAPTLMLTLSYNFNNYKERKTIQGSGEIDLEEDF